MIPETALTKHIAILGKTGSGKTFAAKGTVEGILDRGGLVAILDPTGAWWGLKLNAKGDGPSPWPVTVIGGSHGDLPLPEGSGKACADLIANRPGAAGLRCVVFDVSGMTVGERTRWAIDFGQELYRINTRPLHLVIDEAHNFAPQGKVPDVEAGKMLHAFNSLASGGRSRGLRILMITQRPAKLHKDTLTCADTLVAMRVLAPQDRKAIEEWIDGAGDAKASRQVLDSLAAMKTGEGWVWYPDGGVLERTAFPRIRTYDSSATPEDDAERPQLPVSPDLDRIRTLLGEAAERAAAEDPVKLRKLIGELQRQLREAQAGGGPRPADIEEQLRAAREDADTRCAEHDADHERICKEVESALAGMQDMLFTVCTGIARAREAVEDPFDRVNRTACFEIPQPSTHMHTPSPPPASVPGGKSYAEPPVRAENGSLASVRARASGPTPRAAGGGGTSTPAPDGLDPEQLGTPHQRILDALMWWRLAGHARVTRAQVAALARYAVSGGSFARYLSTLSSAGLIAYPDRGLIELTEQGKHRANVPARSMIGQDALHAAVREVVGGPERKILDQLLHAGGQALTRERLAERVKYKASGGSFARYLSTLSGLQFIVYPSRGQVAAAHWLFPEIRRAR